MSHPDADQPTLPPPDAAPPADDATLGFDGAADAVRADVPGYEIEGELGRGGMGVVYRARQLRLNRTVALKMVLGGGHASATDLIRFLAEAESAAAVQHPGIVQVYEAGQHAGLPYVALEFCPGGTLARQLDGTPMPPRPAAELVERLARSVQAAHEAGVVHRDLKPANVLFTADGAPKVADFGLARRSDAASHLTATGAILGTPSYMAPEQASAAKGVGPAADVWALGAILYECLVGRPPFRAATPLDTILQVVNEEPVAPSRLVPKLPRDIETIALKCLTKEPHRRYATAAALADDLRAYLDGRTITARPAGPTERGWRWLRRNPAAAVVLGVVLAAVGTVVGVLAASNASLQRERDAAQKARDDAEEAGRRARAAQADADAQRAKAQDRLTQAVEAVDKLMVRVAGERWARRPELRGERQKVLLDAVAFFQGLSQEDSRDPRVRRETVNANTRAAGAFVALGDSASARRHLAKAVELQRGLLAESPDDVPALCLLAQVVNLLGSTELLLANYLPAEAHYKEAVEVARRAVALEPPPTAPQAGRGAPLPRVVLCECLTTYGHFLSNRNPAESVKLLDETVTLARQLIRDRNTSYTVRLALAQGLSNQTVVALNRSAYAEAGRLLAEAERLLVGLAGEEAPAARYADHCDGVRMQVLGNRGLLLLRTGNAAAAADKYREALAVVDAMLSHQPSYFPWLYQRLLFRIQVGEALHHAGRADEAKAALADVNAAEQEVLAAYPQHSWIPDQSAILRSHFLVERARRGDLAGLREAFDALLNKAQTTGRSVRYNRACAYSWASATATTGEREGWAGEAVRELARLRDDKYFDAPRLVAHLDTDPDIEPVRGRADYRAFRATLGAEVAPPPRATK